MDQLPRLGKRELIYLLLFTCNYVVSVWRGFLFLWVFWMGYVILLWHSLSLPYNYLVYGLSVCADNKHSLKLVAYRPVHMDEPYTKLHYSQTCVKRPYNNRHFFDFSDRSFLPYFLFSNKQPPVYSNFHVN